MHKEIQYLSSQKILGLIYKVCTIYIKNKYIKAVLSQFCVVVHLGVLTCLQKFCKIMYIYLVQLLLHLKKIKNSPTIFFIPFENNK